MDQVGPFLILFGNCCLMPLVFGWLGYALAKGWIRSPIAISRQRQTQIDDDELFGN